MASLSFIYSFKVKFLLPEAYGKYKSADGAEEQFSLVAIGKKLHLSYWI